MQSAIDVIKDTYDYETCKEIVNHGCKSGVCSQHIYYADTIKFFDTYEDEIVERVTDALEIDTLVSIFRQAEASLKHYKNDLVWTFIELVAMEVVDNKEEQELKDDETVGGYMDGYNPHRSMTPNRYLHAWLSPSLFPERVERLRLITSTFTHYLIMTTAQLKPRPVHKRKTSSLKTMTEHATRKQPPASEPSLDTITKVQSHLPDVQLIERDALWEDLKNRIKINNYECSKAMEDLKYVVHQTHKLARPYVDKAVDKVKELRSKWFSL